MADTEDVRDSVRSIVIKMNRVERALKSLHEELHSAFLEHGHLLGFDHDEVQALAGGGTPKTNPGGGG